MNRSDIDYIIEKLESYKPDNIYDGYNSIREKQDQRVSEVLDSIIEEIKSDYENMRTPMPKELVLTCKLDEDQLQKLKEQIKSAKMSIESVEENGWIKHSEQEPSDYEEILFYDGENVRKGYYVSFQKTYFSDENKYGIRNMYDCNFITYWMPLPSTEGLDDAT